MAIKPVYAIDSMEMAIKPVYAKGGMEIDKIIDAQSSRSPARQIKKTDSQGWKGSREKGWKRRQTTKGLMVEHQSYVPE